MTSTVADLVRQSVADDPDRVALVLDGRHELTVREWWNRARAVAVGLAARRVGPGVPVAVMFRDTGWLEYAVAALAVHLAGGVLVGLPVGLTRAELSRRLAHCEVIGTVHGDDVLSPRHPGWTATLDELTDSPRRRSGRRAGDPGELAEILYTSGSTGDPRPIAVTHANLTYRDSGGRRQLVAGGGGVLAPVSVGTNAGHSALMLAMTAQTTVHVLSRTDTRAVTRALASGRIGLAILPAPLATVLVKGRVKPAPAVRGVMLGSAAVPTSTVHQLPRVLPEARIVVGYGCTEAAPAFCSLPLADPEDYQLGAVGAPAPGTEVLVGDPDGEPARPGELGDIWLRSPAPPRWYHREPQATAATFRRGWVRTGDVGYRDAQGRLFVVDRARDLIASPHGPISSQKVEDALLWHPQVKRAAVVAAEDTVVAYVETRAAVSPRTLCAFAAERLASHEVPGRIVVTDRLPTGSIGKVRKPLLRARAAAKVLLAA